MPTKSKQASLPVTPTLDIFDLCLRGIVKIVDLLTSKKLSKGFNISNWRAQIMGNAGLNFTCVVRMIVSGKKYGKRLQAEFNLAGTKGESGSRLDDYQNGDVKDKPTEVLSAIGFFFQQLVIGKPMSVVNAGRGKILQDILNTLKPSELYVDIVDVPVDANTKVTYTYDLTDVLNFANTFAYRSRMVTDLDNRDGRVTKTQTARKEVTDVDW